VPAYKIETLAETGDQWLGFAPYVAAINPRGEVAFQAALRVGGTGLFLTQGNAISCVYDTVDSIFGYFYSHPALNHQQDICFYAKRLSGQTGLFLRSSGQLKALALTGNGLTQIGPLGPTMNQKGKIAFRASDVQKSGIFTVSRTEDVNCIADTQAQFSAFQGLPLINDLDQVVFRADLKNADQGIFMAEKGQLRAVAETGPDFSHLGLFPCLNANGNVVFSATKQSGESGIFQVATQAKSQVKMLVDNTNGFESFRGALLSDQEQLIFFATTQQGNLGIFTGPDPQQDKLLAIRDPYLDSQIAEFALNSVSINAQGQLALRLKLANGKELIVRASLL
jgi:hypothetical protein